MGRLGEISLDLAGEARALARELEESSRRHPSRSPGTLTGAMDGPNGDHGGNTKNSHPKGSTMFKTQVAHKTTTATPEQYVAGLTDFGPGRAELFGNSADS